MDQARSGSLWPAKAHAASLRGTLPCPGRETVGIENTTETRTMQLTHNTRAVITAVLAAPAMLLFIAALAVGFTGEPSKGAMLLGVFLVFAIAALFFAPETK